MEVFFMTNTEAKQIIDAIRVPRAEQFVTLSYYGDVDDQRTYKRFLFPIGD